MNNPEDNIEVRMLVRSLATHTPWAKVESFLKPFLDLPPHERGVRFAAFLRKCGQIEVPSKNRQLLMEILRLLASDDGIHFQRDLGKFVKAWKKETLPECPRLELISTTTVPATRERFIAKMLLVRKEYKLKVFVREDFTRWFLDGSGKIEEPIEECCLNGYIVRTASSDSTLIAEQGGETKAKTTLAEIDFLIRQQQSGRKGVLLTNGRPNVFYVEDMKDVLRVVRVRRLGRPSTGEWDLFAYSSATGYKWPPKVQVFFRGAASAVVPIHS